MLDEDTLREMDDPNDSMLEPRGMTSFTIDLGKSDVLISGDPLTGTELRLPSLNRDGRLNFIGGSEVSLGVDRRQSDSADADGESGERGLDGELLPEEHTLPSFS